MRDYPYRRYHHARFNGRTKAHYYLLYHAYRWARHYHDATDCDADWTRAQVYAAAQALRTFCERRGRL